jgi:hypothetical protein
VPPSGTSLQYVTSATYDVLNRPTGISWTPAAAAAPATGSGVTFNHTYKANQRDSQTVTDNSWLNYPAASPSTVSYTATPSSHGHFRDGAEAWEAIRERPRQNSHAFRGRKP